MTDKLFALINKLRPTEGISQYEVDQIQKASWKIEKKLDKYKLKHPEALHNFAKMVFNEISLEIQEIQKSISEQESKLENGMDNVKLEKVDLTIKALSEIGTILDDLRTVILEYLIIYFPKGYKQYLPELEKLNRFSKVVKIEKLRKPETEHQEATVPQLKKAKNENRVRNLTQKEIALLLFYEGITINKMNENCEQYAAEYGYTSKNSGKKITDFFRIWKKQSNRIPSEDSKTKDKNKLEIFKKIIPLIKDPEGKQKAIDEQKLLKIYFDTNY